MVQVLRERFYLHTDQMHPLISSLCDSKIYCLLQINLTILFLYRWQKLYLATGMTPIITHGQNLA